MSTLNGSDLRATECEQQTSSSFYRATHNAVDINCAIYAVGRYCVRLSSADILWKRIYVSSDNQRWMGTL